MKKILLCAAVAAVAYCGAAFAQPGMKPGLWQVKVRLAGEAGGEDVPIPPTKICLSREQAEKQDVASPQGDCKITKQARSGNTMSVSFACANPKSTGEQVVRFTSAEAYSSKLTLVEGSDKTVIESEAKWLAADCGSLKPVARPATR